MTFGPDISEYQGPKTVDYFKSWGFAILRADNGYRADNWIAYNLPIVEESGVPYGVYLYLVPDRPVADQVNRMLRTVPKPPSLGYWIDYEQVGLNAGHLADAFNMLDIAGMPSGYYSNDDGTAFHKPFLNRPWWAAAYPGKNNGAYPGPRSFSRPAQLWQFTSTGGTQDVSVVVDEPWFAGTHTPQPQKIPTGASKVIRVFVEGVDWFLWNGGSTLVIVGKDEFEAATEIPLFRTTKDSPSWARIQAAAAVPAVTAAGAASAFKGTFDAVPV